MIASSRSVRFEMLPDAGKVWAPPGLETVPLSCQSDFASIPR